MDLDQELESLDRRIAALPESPLKLLYRSGMRDLYARREQSRELDEEYARIKKIIFEVLDTQAPDVAKKIRQKFNKE